MTSENLDKKLESAKFALDAKFKKLQEEERNKNRPSDDYKINLSELNEIMRKMQESEENKLRNIEDNIYVRYGKTLTIYPGSIWKFASSKGIYVDGGLLQILGTKNEPVVLQAKMTSWKGITIQNSRLNNLIEYATIKEANCGGITNKFSNLFLNQSIIEKCEILAIWGGGAGINNTYSDVRIEYSNIMNNSASSFGGGIYNLKSNVRLEHSIISGNKAGKHGGGIYISSGTKLLQFDNSVSYNTPDDIYQSK